MSQQQTRQPRGVPVGGQYATSGRDESGVSLASVSEGGGDGDDLTTWAPTDVDAELYRLYEVHGRAMHRWSSQHDFVSGEIARHKYSRGWNGTCSPQELADAVKEMRERVESGEADYSDRSLLGHHETAAKYLAEAEAAEAAMVPLNEEFDRRGGWPRAFLVSNSNGHVHSSMNCSTCFAPGYKPDGSWREGTRYHWVTEMSDKTEDEIVEAAGERACTVCYPSAPSETLARPTTLFTPDEIEKQAARKEREAAQAARDAKKIAAGLTADGSEFVATYVEKNAGMHVRRPDGSSGYEYADREHRERFKTERAATQWAVDKMAWLRDDTARLAEYQPAIDQIVEAVAAKHDLSRDEVLADFAKKVTAKRKRDGYSD